jgi:hypothetical protein
VCNGFHPVLYLQVGCGEGRSHACVLPQAAPVHGDAARVELHHDGLVDGELRQRRLRHRDFCLQPLLLLCGGARGDRHSHGHGHRRRRAHEYADCGARSRQHACHQHSPPVFVVVVVVISGKIRRLTLDAN